MSHTGRTLAVVCAAAIAAVVGLVVSIRVNGPGPLLLNAPGRWLAEYVAPAKGPDGAKAISEGGMIGPLVLTDFNGQRQPLPAAPGRRTLVNVWASWCEPCRDEMPLLGAFAKSQESGGTVVIGIAQDDPATVRGYLLRTPVNYLILFDDAQGGASMRLGNRLGALPYTALIDKDGRLLRRKYGPFKTAAALAAWASAP